MLTYHKSYRPNRNSATNATFEAADTDTGIVSGETVGVTFDYKYKTSNPESGTTTDVEITNIALIIA